MGFKTIEEYDDERYHDMFMLKDDGDSEDAIILYRDIKDVLVGAFHYIKSENFSGYVHCLGQSKCPACQYGKNGIPVQNKLFIPLYMMSGPNAGKILFWDRTPNFQQTVLEPQVFHNFPNPIEYVFRITRNGVRGSWDTKYQITAIGKNSEKSYDDILKELDIKMPDYYETICKEWDAAEYNRHLTQNTDSTDDYDVDTMPEYKITPREVTSPEIPDYSEVDKTQPNSEEVNIDDVKF